MVVVLSLILIKIMKNKYHFKHRGHRDWFTYLLDNLFKIECSGLIDCKPMMTESEKETFLLTLDKAKKLIYE